MPTIARNAKPGLDTASAVRASQIAGNKFAGENLDAGAPCRIGADGKVYMSIGAANDANAQVDGFTGVDYRTGEPVTLFGPGVILEYGAALTPGANLYLSATKGRLDDAATVGGLVKIARVIDATHIVVLNKQ